jgi:dTDP-glucose 4,6-dehydratase
MSNDSGRESPTRTMLVTGGAGFIGSHLVRTWLQARPELRIVNLDRLTYAGHVASLRDVERRRQVFVQGDVRDRRLVAGLLRAYRPQSVVHLAAESHVDRSIDGPAEFLETNVTGTLALLETTTAFWRGLDEPERARFRYLQVSTDEVYGSLGPRGAFTESTSFAPNSPYAASKAGADHLARAFFRTYGLPTLVTHCSNNYGPFQYPEKLIPLTILNAAERRELPVYGDGGHVRDWLHVRDHVDALERVLERGQPGEAYNVGGGIELTNLELVGRICDLVDAHLADGGLARRALIRFVADRPGHDRRYAIDGGKISKELGWTPRVNFEDALTSTVNWYLENRDWAATVLAGRYDRERLGVQCNQ